MAPKRIMVLTGKRGGYGAMRAMLTLLRDDPFFDLCLVATDMHLSGEFGYTVNEIEKDFPDVTRIEMHNTGRASGQRSLRLGQLQSNISLLMENDKPDCLILFGDRGESLAAATAALHMSIPIAHIQGGDRTGGIDDSIRYAISHMSTWHFVSHKEAADILITYSRDINRIYNVGDLHIDAIRNIKKTLQSKGRPGIIVVIYHPETGPGAFDPGEGMESVAEAVLSLEGRRLVFIYPCSDPGYKGITEVLEDLPHGREYIGVYKNMEQDDFLNLLSRAELIVGNSSCGIIEAPYFDLSTVNVGHRQSGRLQCGNVINCGTESKAIGVSIRAALKMSGPYNKPYGDGHAGEKIVKILKEVL